jgi:hypothetical protein
MQNSRKRYLITFLLLAGVLFTGVWALTQPSRLSPETELARQAQADALGLEGLDRMAYMSPSVAGEEEEDVATTLEMGDFWGIRVSYPTGIFDPNWYVEAAKEDRQMATGLPAGTPTDVRESGGGNLDPTQFTSLGPEPLDSRSFFDAAGRTNVIVVDPVNNNVAYAGSDGGGVWKTTNCCDANTTWSATTDDPIIFSNAIGDLHIDPNDHNTIYAGTGDLRYGSWSFGSYGLLKSTDGGANWAVLGEDVFNAIYEQPPGEFPQYGSIGKVRVDPRNSSNVIVGTKQGVYFSYNGGVDWDGPCFTNGFTSQRQDATGVEVSDNGSSTDLYVAIGTRGFPTPVQPDLGLTGANGIYKTTVPASGCPASWTLVTRSDNGWPAGTGDGDPANDLIGRIDMTMAPSNNDILYAQVGSNNNSSGTQGVWRTDDGGTTWTHVALPGDFSGCGSGIGQTWYNAGLTVDPNNPDNVFLSQIDLYRSTDGGDTFQNLTGGYCNVTDVHVDHHGRAFVGNSSSDLLIGSDGGIFLTTNADVPNPSDVSFIGLNATMNTIEFYSGDITENFNTSAEPGANGGAQDNGSMVIIYDSGPPGPARWTETTGGDGMFARIEPKQEIHWYQESQNGGLKVSLGGPYGPYVTAAGPWGGERKSFILPYEIDKFDCDGAPGCEHLIAGTYRVWEHVNHAQPAFEWYVNSPDLTKGTLAGRSFIQQLNYSTTDNRIAIVGTLDGNVWYGFGLGQGVANSATWVDVTGGNAVLPNRPVMDVVTHPSIPTTGYASLGGFNANTPSNPGHVYEVTCNADCSSFTWVDKSGNLPDVPINSIIVNPRIPTQVFAGSDWGLYYTDDISVASPTWNRFTAGLPGVMIWDMAIDRGFTTLALFTRSRGAYVWPLPGPQAASPQEIYVGSGEVGQPVTYQVTITNTGDITDTFDATVEESLWPVTFSENPLGPLAPGESTSIDLTVTPQSAITDTAEVLFSASSTGGGWTRIYVQTTGEVNQFAGINTSGDMSAVGVKGEDLVYQITVTNTGNVTDTFAVMVGSTNWTTNASVGSIGPLAPNESGTVEVTVTVGNGPADSVEITFTSGFDNNVTAVVTLNSSSNLTFLPVVLSKP